MQLTSSSFHRFGTANDSKRSAPQSSLTTKGLEPNRENRCTKVNLNTCTLSFTRVAGIYYPTTVHNVHSFINMTDRGEFTIHIIIWGIFLGERVVSCHFPL